QLYALEREAKDIDEETRLALRQGRSVPVLSAIKEWLDTEDQIVLPRSPMGLAMQYAQNQWVALTTYTTQGFLKIDNNASTRAMCRTHSFLKIDNNASERALKRVALGRKNWLFAGHDAAAENHARLWSLIASAERHGVDPQRYLTSLLAKIGQTPAGELEQF